jgi:hypothetical protein
MKGRFDMPKGTNPEILSIEELQTKYGVKAVPGKLSGTKGKYTLAYGGKRVALDPKLLISEQPLDKTIKGTVDVAVIANAKGIMVIIVTQTKLPWRPIIVCYYPKKDFFNFIEKEIQQMAFDNFAKSVDYPPAFLQMLKGNLNLGKQK